MITFSTKIASATGQKYKPEFQRLASPLRLLRYDGHNTLLRSRTDVWAGFLVRSTRMNDRITIQAIDPPGNLGLVNNHYLADTVDTLFGTQVLAPALPRDSFSPLVPLPDDWKPLQYTLPDWPKDMIRDGYIHATFLGDAPPALFNVFCPSPWKTCRNGVVIPTTVGIGEAIGRPNVIAFDGNLWVRLFLMRNAMWQQKLAEGGSAINEMVVINEQWVRNVTGGYEILPRTTDVYQYHQYMHRFLPLVSAELDGDLLYVALTVVKNPPVPSASAEVFPYVYGDAAILVLRLRRDNEARLYIPDWQHLYKLDDETGYPLKLEGWDTSLPWLQSSPNTSGQMFDPVGGWLDTGTVQGNTANVIIAPQVVLHGDRLEVAFTANIQRQFHDPRTFTIPSDDALYTPVEVQKQSVIARLVVPIDDQGNMGLVSRVVDAADCTGDLGNACLAQFGHYADDGARLFQSLWGSRVGDKTVQLVAVQRYKRDILDGSHGSSVGGYPADPFCGTYIGTNARWVYDPEFPQFSDMDSSPRELWWLVDGVPYSRRCIDLGHSWRLFNPDPSWLFADYNSDSYGGLEWPTWINQWAAVGGVDLVFYVAYGYDGPDGPYDTSNTLNGAARFAKVCSFSVTTGETTELFSIERPGALYFAAISCFQQQVRNEKGDITTHAALLFSLGKQQPDGEVDPASKVFISKDSGASWDVLASGHVGWLGAYYAGSALWTPADFTNMFTSH
ncbi:hypothetical protein FEA48_30805 [Pseudomonas nitroreducens]|uniref:Uncharacterized protein n=1 Tax=Pseudomonas nitroreducens TaxID=46680 RepID=A0A5R8ZQA3_PSENT|nr:hypothetical protein [Pseudomonas nitroreducens]TLP68246.1 hypothetical protein FEA48_30805 [Pseudomonas nitroreducens]